MLPSSWISLAEYIVKNKDKIQKGKIKIEPNVIASKPHMVIGVTYDEDKITLHIDEVSIKSTEDIICICYAGVYNSQCPKHAHGGYYDS